MTAAKSGPSNRTPIFCVEYFDKFQNLHSCFTCTNHVYCEVRGRCRRSCAKNRPTDCCTHLHIHTKMFALRRTLATGVRQVAARRTFSSALVLRNENKQVEALQKEFEQVKGFDDLLPAGAPEGTVPTEANQATGLERFEYLAKVAGVEPFDMAPLDASRLGTMKDPIMVPSLEPMRYAFLLLGALVTPLTLTRLCGCGFTRMDLTPAASSVVPFTSLTTPVTQMLTPTTTKFDTSEWGRMLRFRSLLISRGAIAGPERCAVIF
ncbi:hypothetical protein G7K_4343-t1 [Saitoella complicata NRRL Y-17804]|uniref:Uncharacterized protein n=1 Tax=Saitoella complicata (strain BCRC 22490 / CBS 7301 / JCM 7358 / NBRC 10748 / NRRL Y-17804) TaxID=698492 RepID=A0A0E9NKI2_SAICN|nr:hypothetical protein G7K_4343-t1 [Saitoella complicata NRRL Y-17804]